MNQAASNAFLLANDSVVLFLSYFYFIHLQLIEGTHQLLATFGDCHFVNQLAAWLPYWAIKLFFRKTVRTLAGGIAKLADYIQKQIDKHRNTFDPDNMRDFLDIYIKHRTGEKDFTDHRFACTAMNFLPDAIDTTGYTLLWCLLYLGYNLGESNLRLLLYGVLN